MAGIRKLNLIGTVFFALFGILIPVLYIFLFGMILFLDPYGSGYGFFSMCLVIIIAWIFFIIYLTYQIHDNTVVGIDEGRYDDAKRWMLYAMVLGFFFAGGSLGLITLILFLVGYVSFDDAIRRQYWCPQSYYEYPPPAYLYYGPPPYYGQYPPYYGAPNYQQHQQWRPRENRHPGEGTSCHETRPLCPVCKRPVQPEWDTCRNCYSRLK